MSVESTTHETSNLNVYTTLQWHQWVWLGSGHH